MPVWNRAHLVERAINSVLNQTFKDWELIIIDDGSSDDLEDIISPCLSNKISYHRIHHGGVSKARNFGLERARGDIIAYLDSDNEWHPQFLSKMHKAVANVKGDHAAAYCITNVYEKDPRSGRVKYIEKLDKAFNFKDLIEVNFIDMNSFVHLKNCLRYSGNFDEKLKRLVDWDLIIRITSKFKPLFIREALVDYYRNIENNALTLTEDLSAPLRKIIDKNKKYEEPVVIEHDTIRYSFKDLPNDKYYNWVRMNSPEMDTEDYAAWGYPYMLQIEPTSLCNLSCRLCPSGQKKLKRAYRHMTFDEYRPIIDDMSKYLMLLVLWDWGEPLMNPEFPAMVRYASEKDIKTVTSTNGHFLNNEDYLAEVLSSGLTTMIVAIDSLKQTDYDAYRHKGSVDNAISGLEKAVKMKKKLGSETTIMLRMMIMKQNEGELDAMRAFARAMKVDIFAVKTVYPSSGLISAGEEYLPENPKYRRYMYKKGTNEPIRVAGKCSYVWHMSNIFSNGDVASCCRDFDAEYNLGNVFKTPFSKIWRSRAYSEFRKRIYLNKDSFEKCRNCSISFQLSESGWYPETLDLRQ